MLQQPLGREKRLQFPCNHSIEQTLFRNTRLIERRKGSHANRELRTPRSTGCVNGLKHFAKWLAQNVWENTEQKSNFSATFTGGATRLGCLSRSVVV